MPMSLRFGQNELHAVVDGVWVGGQQPVCKCMQLLFGKGLEFSVG